MIGPESDYLTFYFLLWNYYKVAVITHECSFRLTYRLAGFFVQTTIKIYKNMINCFPEPCPMPKILNGILHKTF